MLEKNAPAAQAANASRDWFRPIPVGRFGVLSALTAAPQAGLSSLGGMVAPDGTDIDPTMEVPGWPENAGPARTELLAGYDADNLYLRVVCQEPSPARMRLHHPDLSRNDHLIISLDPTNDHHRYLQLLVLPDGRSQVSWSTNIYGYLPGDLNVSGEGGSLAVAVAASASPDGWTVDVTVPWHTVGLSAVRSGYCIGLNASRFRTVGAEQLAQWSPTFGYVRDARFFGDLYLGKPAAILQEVRLGEFHWGPNRGHARFAASAPVWAWVEPRESVTAGDGKPVRLEPGPYGFAGFSFDYTIDPMDILKGRLTIRWSDCNPAESRSKAQAAASEASFVFGWKRSVLLTHSMRRASKPSRPQGNISADFFVRMCDYLLSRLPHMSREAGRYLVSDDGARIDLLDSDPLMALAKMIVERIDGFDDQLAACALVLCQPGLLISSGVLTRLVNGVNAPSALWAGGAFCDVYSLLLAELVERVASLNGRRIPTGLFWLPAPKGSEYPWPNHWWGCAWLERGLVILDAELGRFYYRRDGRTLATAEDLFADPSLADVAGTGLGDYFRLNERTNGLIRKISCWREIRPV